MDYKTIKLDIKIPDGVEFDIYSIYEIFNEGLGIYNLYGKYATLDVNMLDEKDLILNITNRDVYKDEDKK